MFFPILVSRALKPDFSRAVQPTRISFSYQVSRNYVSWEYSQVELHRQVFYETCNTSVHIVFLTGYGEQPLTYRALGVSKLVKLVPILKILGALTLFTDTTL